MELKDFTIGIVGAGVVGRATARTYLEHVREVRVWDLIKERRTATPEEVFASSVVFICVPEAEVKAACYLGEKGRWANLVLKSTVPIGTTKSLYTTYGLKNLVHSPEFLTARCANVDAQLPTRNIIGAPRVDSCGRGLGEGVATYRTLLLKRFPGVGILEMGSNESEALKLIQNGFFAVKVAFWNEMRSLTDSLGLDWERIREAILLDGRIHPSHTKVPGPDGLRGFGGACLPKDLQQLINELVTAAPRVRTLLCEAARDRNLFDRKSDLESSNP